MSLFLVLLLCFLEKLIRHVLIEFKIDLWQNQSVEFTHSHTFARRVMGNNQRWVKELRVNFLRILSVIISVVCQISLAIVHLQRTRCPNFIERLNV